MSALQSVIEPNLLRRLGSGEPVSAICDTAGWTRSEFNERWKRETEWRAGCPTGSLPTSVSSTVEILRDRRGIPHIFADRAADLWFGFGLAMAQDRLFQLDYLRRKGHGRLSEVLGQTGIASDLTARTVGLNRLAREEWTRLPPETRQLLQSFSSGVSEWINQCRDRLPIEFALLGYAPEPWNPVDCLAIETEVRWYLTGRFPVIVMPELARRVLGDTELYREFLLGEDDEEAIIPPEAYRSLLTPGHDAWSDLPHRTREDVGQALGQSEPTGSNNWVVAGRHCRSGAPMVAGDPHIAFEAVSCWYEAHLCGDGFNVAGMSYVGMPAIMSGRNDRIAFAITNNICSQRDLYQEKTDPAHPGAFLYDGQWEPARTLVETIPVQGSPPVTRTIRFSRNGPIVDEILPPPGNQTGPVSLKWLGAFHGGWLTALLAIDRAKSVAEFRDAVRPWHVPTFNMAVADVAGQIGLQTTGRIPLRQIACRGYRPGWDPQHQWLGLLPFEFMPHATNPQRGWLISANNRLAANDYPWPLYGTWSGGQRALRIRQMIETRLDQMRPSNDQPGFGWEDFRNMHHDTVSLRAVACLPSLLSALEEDRDPQVQSAIGHLRGWDGRIETELVAPTLFNVFFSRWASTVAHARFSGATAELLTRLSDGIASRLLSGDPHGWFLDGQRLPALRATFRQTLELLATQLGPNMADWTWGKLHPMPLKHVLSGRGELSELLDHGGLPAKGDLITVCNTGMGNDWKAATGAGYRMIADLSTRVLLAVDVQSQSGQPGSPHYADQTAAWNSGEYHAVPLDRADLVPLISQQLLLVPRTR